MGKTCKNVLISFLFSQHDNNVHYNNSSIYCCHCCPKRYQRGHQLSGHLIKMHKFQLASGHSRFAYRQDLDGCFRLQTMRIESLEVSQQIMARNPNEPFPIVPVPNDVVFSCKPIEQNERGELSLVVKILNDDKEELDEAGQDAALSMPDLRCRTRLSEELPPPDDNDDTISSVVLLGRTLRSNKTKVEDMMTNKKRTETMTKTVSSSTTKRSDSTDTIKGIEEFSMMKRYLDGATTSTAALTRNEAKKHILIELNEIDAHGNVINTELVKANEFHI